MKRHYTISEPDWWISEEVMTIPDAEIFAIRIDATDTTGKSTLWESFFAHKDLVFDGKKDFKVDFGQSSGQYGTFSNEHDYDDAARPRAGLFLCGR